ncbi:MAG TPA: chemotaxis response regulator protein-glutamate methylesterase [Thermoanaerobaculia bacterium]|nr:chemotaxis response regulator protein-glutamate methylesterase [Thermoanaerobaculia bacterium]
MSNSLRVLVVDDSAVVRQTIRSLLGTQPDITTSVAHDPLMAMEKMKRERPDVIILDLEMPRMDGLTFLRQIMKDDPIPVIICSGYVGEASVQAIHALQAGAVELIAKPRVGVQAFLEESAVLLIDAVRAAAASNPVRLLTTAKAARPVLSRPKPLHEPRLIAIGASTGGTDALREILRELPASTCGIAIVQHMPEFFTRSFAKNLNEVCAIDVKEAESGDELRAGVALIAPGDKHLVVLARGTRFYVDVVDGPLVSRHRPSVDVLFRSVATAAGASAIGVILTGMGADGADGLATMKKAGAATIAQDEASCVVFGMPREAIKRGAVDRVLPVSEIANALTSQ